MRSPIDIYAFTNFREFLRDYYNACKAAAPEKFSHRYVSAQAGFATSNFLYLVMQGKRNLGHASILKLAKVMRLKKRESLFFESLVQFNQAKDAKGKEFAFQRMLAFKEYRQAQQLEPAQYDYFAKWYYPVIREMVHLSEFRESPQWIAKRLQPSISVTEADEALRKLVDLGLLRRNEDGKLQQTDQNIATDEEIASTALLAFHQSMIEHGKESLSRPADEREVSALTLSLSRNQFEQVRGKLRELHRDVQAMIADNGHEPVETICQLNFQLFDLVGKQRRPS